MLRKLSLHCNYKILGVTILDTFRLIFRMGKKKEDWLEGLGKVQGFCGNVVVWQ